MGENLFLFPYRIFPYTYKHPNSIFTLYDEGWTYPKTNHGEKTINPIKILDIIMLKASDKQEDVYSRLVDEIEENNKIKRLSQLFNNRKSTSSIKHCIPR